MNIFEREDARHFNPKPDMQCEFVVSTALAVGLGLAATAGAATVGSVMSAKASGAQAEAGLNAAQLDYKAQEDALAFQKQQWETQQKQMAPWLKAGTGAINTLSGMLQGGGFPDWNQQFQAPTALTEQNDPGFQARLNLGAQALERSAAARGGVLSGGTSKALNQYAQDYASNEYSNVYNRAFNEYATKYNEFQQNQANKFNRFASISGLGQQTAQQLGLLGNQASSNVGNILMTGAQAQGNALQQAAAARASGYAAQGNIWGNAISAAGQAPLNYLLLNDYLS